MPVLIPMDESMVARHWNVIYNSYIAILPASNFDFVLALARAIRDQVFCVDNVEDLFIIIIETF